MTRPNLRTLVQSISRHDAEFPAIAEYRNVNMNFGTNSAMEGGTLIRDSKTNTGNNTELLKERIIGESGHGRNEMRNSDFTQKEPNKLNSKSIGFRR